jgi:glycosyltransferase involved in cell wall biosynthesis
VAGPRPRVSTIIPAYNAGVFIADAIESSLAQDYEPHDIVVIDDGSTDETADVAARYPVRLLRQANRGVAAARNAGIAACEGELIALLDADDRSVPGRIAAQVEIMLAKPDAVCVLGLETIFVEEGVEQPHWIEVLPRNEDGTSVAYPPATGLYRRAAIEALGGFAEDMRMGEDGDLLMRLKESGGEVILADIPTVERRMHGGNLTADEARLRLGITSVLKRRIDRRRAG